MAQQPELLPNEPSHKQAEREAERAAYLERLREKLKDPDFRAIEGFPIGEDEDILALSDPPYYTACPNPFVSEIIERWREERTELRKELDLPDDSGDDESGHSDLYHREPFAADVSEGKYSSIYRAHTYHTKVPHKAVMRYILHYTDPGDVVLDGFCGTGMTGVAAQLCGDQEAVRDLGYRVDSKGVVSDGDRMITHLGDRRALLIDLCPAATFITYNFNVPVDVGAFQREAESILSEVEDELRWMYQTWHPRCDSPQRVRGNVNYTVWSDVFICPECGEELVFWHAAVDKETRKVRRKFCCPFCDAVHSKRDLEYAWDVVYDRALGRPVRRGKQVPVLINYTAGQRDYEKRPDEEDRALIQEVRGHEISYWYPSDRMMFRRGKWGDQWRSSYHRHVTHVHHFYTHRNLLVSSSIVNRIRQAPVDERLKSMLLLWFQSVALTFTSLNRYLRNAYSQVNRFRNGTLYVPALRSEVSPQYALENKIAWFKRTFAGHGSLGDVAIATSSSTDLEVPHESIDYVFVDPPFGSNLMYSELNFIWESWLRVFTNSLPEAVVSATQQKSLVEYQRLMECCFQEFYALLKPGHWMTVEFHNSKNRVWNAIQEALLKAGFVVGDVRTFDKQQGTFNQVTASGAVKQDLIISAYKPRSGFTERFLEHAGTPEGAWAFVRQHMEQLPVVVEQDGVLEVIAERQAYLLYDRMVAFHIQRGLSVPMGAAAFYAGLKQRFPERDGMYFLPSQAAEYDRRRLQVSKVEQLALFVTDEKSAIQWLRRELNPETGAGPQTYQDLQPKFLQELHQARHEDLPELSEMLAQSFLQDEQDRWYIPDLARQEDLEKLRERSLLREFREYAQGKGRLKVFRTEAVRTGFKHAWQEHDYRLIINVAERLPTSVLQEDSSLLMYYDNALTRAAEEPRQGELF
jgi:hypothetical protein